MTRDFDKFKERISNKNVKKKWDNAPGVKKKFFDFFYQHVQSYENPQILEFGVRDGTSTALFLDICKKNNGNLFSVDNIDYSFQFEDEKWKFIQSKDDNFTKIDKEIPPQLDVIFLDTIHEADHVSKIFYYYYDKLKVNGLFIIDDISWLLYTKNNIENHFYKEINNYETFIKMLEIYDINRDQFDIHVNFCDTGAIKIIKRNLNKLNKPKKIYSRENTLKNFIRKLYIKFKNY